MPKITTTICLDYEVWRTAREIFPNISGAVNELLSAAVIEKKPEAKNLMDLTQKITILEEKYGKLKRKYEKRAEKYQDLKEKTAVRWNDDPIGTS